MENDAIARLRMYADHTERQGFRSWSIGLEEARAILAAYDTAVAALAQRDADIVARFRTMAAFYGNSERGQTYTSAADAIEAGAYKGAGDPAPPADGEG
jgi:ABC-type Fe3+-hydroxamate transport system substrate-binding protein